MELQNLYAALAQPVKGLTVSYPVSDVNGSQLRPAFVVERLLKLFPRNRLEREKDEKEYRLSAVVPALETAGQDPGGPVWQWFAERAEWMDRLSAMKRLGATILMVTHDAFSASYANRILFMRDGAIFTEIRKGGDSRRTFFEKILDVLTMMGGGMSDVR